MGNLVNPESYRQGNQRVQKSIIPGLNNRVIVQLGPGFGGLLVGGEVRLGLR